MYSWAERVGRWGGTVLGCTARSRLRSAMYCSMNVLRRCFFQFDVCCLTHSSSFCCVCVYAFPGLHRYNRAQMLLRRTRMASLLGSAVGVTLGCLIGMFPLLLMPAAETVEAVKRKEKVRCADAFCWCHIMLHHVF